MLKARKIYETIAHSQPIKCLALGHKSGQVLATGGDDLCVKVWAVGKAICLMTLNGHTSSLDSLRFSNDENVIVSGSVAGTFKSWDLRQQKLIRTASGHKASITSIDCHPWCQYVVTGSLDSSVKLWDFRQRNCLFTYKGHVNAINSVRFSPDGRWVASASEDCCVKLWDLTAGKQLSEFKGHNSSVRIAEFHPHEYVLATAGLDRRVMFWCLEQMDLISVSSPEATPFRTILYVNEGDFQGIVAGFDDMVRLYSWEPLETLCTIHTGWKQVSDTAFVCCRPDYPYQQIVGASFTHNTLNVFSFNLNDLMQKPTRLNEPKKRYSTNRKTFNSKNTTDFSELFKPQMANFDDKYNFSKGKPHDDLSKIRVLPNVEMPCAPIEKLCTETVRGVESSNIVSIMPSEMCLTSTNTFRASKARNSNAYMCKSNTCDNESDFYSLVANSNEDLIQVLDNRLRFHNLAVNVLQKRDLKEIVLMLSNSDDVALHCNFIQLFLNNISLWSLDFCCIILPLILKLFTSDCVYHVSIGCDAMKLILRSFGELIHSTLTTSYKLGVDVIREERTRKCEICFKQLKLINSMLRQLSKESKYQSLESIKEVFVLLNIFDELEE